VNRSKDLEGVHGSVNTLDLDWARLLDRQDFRGTTLEGVHGSVTALDLEWARLPDRPDFRGTTGCCVGR